jgi:hypothetical protein
MLSMSLWISKDRLEFGVSLSLGKNHHPFHIILHNLSNKYFFYLNEVKTKEKRIKSRLIMLLCMWTSC